MSKAIRPLKITFHMDGSGVLFFPYEPTHFDALIAREIKPFQTNQGLQRDEKPEDLKLPLGKWHRNGYWGWSASAVLPEGNTFESMQYYRKKTRLNRLHLTKGSVNLSMGKYREVNNPMPLTNCLKMVAYAVGNRSRIKQLAKRMRGIGKKVGYGKGYINDVEVEVIDRDYSCVKDGFAMRFLPDENGMRIGRIRPPYFNQVGCVKTCYVGDVIE